MSATIIFGLEHARDPVDLDDVIRIVRELAAVREQSDPHDVATEPPGSLISALSRIGISPSPTRKIWSAAAPVAPEAISFGSARGKDEVAHAVVALINYVALQLGGWAINHVIGQALAEQSGHVIDANSHESEIEGQRYAALHGQHGDENAALKRTVLRAAIGPTCCLAPIDLIRELRDGFLALNLGETPPLLAPSKVPLKGKAFTLARLRIIALEHVYFQWGKGGKGFTKDEALAYVAKELGVGRHRIIGWETAYLPKFFDKQGVQERTNVAKAAGAFLDSKDPTRADTIDGAVAACFTRLEDNPLASLKKRLAAAETKKSPPTAKKKAPRGKQSAPGRKRRVNTTSRKKT